MRKRVFCLLLLLMMVVTMLSVEAGAEPALRAYSSGVVRGQIRYVSQNSNLDANGWGAYKNVAGGECGYASQSMALSYLGKDVSPEYLCNGEYSQGKWETNYGITYDVSGISVVSGSGAKSGSDAVNTIDTMLSNHINDNNTGNLSPVVIHYASGSTMHAIIIINKNSSGNYIAVDPAKGMSTYTFNISSSGVVSGNVTYGSVGCSIDRVEQYRLSTPVNPTYLDKCTFYPSYATGVTKNGTWLKKYPCSYDTDHSSTSVIEAGLANGTKVSIIGVYKNSVGNYWYKVKLSSGSYSGKEGYLFAGDVTATLLDDTVTYSGKAFPTSMTVGKTYDVDWTVKSTNLNMVEVRGYIYGGSNLNEQKYYGAVENLNAKSFGLKGTAVDSALLYNKLSAGTYKTVITAVTKNNYSTDGKTLQTKTSTSTALSFTFSEVSSGTQSYYLDLNGYIDVSSVGNISSAGVADIYINGNLEAKNVTDYYKAWPAGTKYEIKNIRGFGYKYNGTQSGSLSGTIGSANTAVVLSFSQIPQNSTAANAVEFNNHRYERYDYHLTWTEAKAFCEEKGGHLVTIADEDEQQIVFFLIEGCPFGVYYIGGTDPNQSGNWTWVTGESFSYENWDKDYPEPGQEEGEYYSAIIGIDNPPNKSVGEWIDCPNETVWTGDFYSKINTGFICEYEPQEYTVTFDANGGTGAPESETSSKEFIVTLPSVTPVRADSAAGNYTVTLDPNGGSVGTTRLEASRTTSYTFKNWNTATDGSGVSYNPGADYAVAESVTLYAQWNSSTTTASVTLPTPTREGYEFLGWAESTDATGGVTGSYTPSENVSLYAIWKESNLASGNWHNLSWTLDTRGLLTVSGSGNMEDFSFSSDAWREYKEQINSIVIESGITSIGQSAFASCKNLVNISIPNSVESIGEFAFYYCTSVLRVDIPSGVTVIGANAFMSCTSLVSVTFPSSLISIGDAAFDSCTSLVDVTIPSGVISIGNVAFGGCSRLTNVKLPSSVTSLGSSVFKNCSNLTSVSLSESLIEIKESTFSGCANLMEVEIPSDVTSIGNAAFSGCSGLTNLVLPANITSIGEDAFRRCTGLNSVTIPPSVITIGDFAFYVCYNLKDVYYNGTYSQWDAIEMGNYNQPLTSAVIHFTGYTVSYEANGGAKAPESQIKTAGEALILSTEIPTREGCLFLGWATRSTATEAEYQPGSSFMLDADTTLYAVWAAPDFVLPAALTTIEQEAFEGGAFTYVKLGENTAKIGSRAFADCPNLAYIYIPETTTMIAKDAFAGVSGLTIYGEEGSYAEFFAQRNGFTFIAG